MSGSKEVSKSLSSSSSSGTNPAQNTDNRVTSTNGYIRLRVINSDRTNEVHFRLKMDVPMIRMKRSYAFRLGYNENELRFVFDGARITDEDTPRGLGMVDEDVIEIYQEKTGGGM